MRTNLLLRGVADLHHSLIPCQVQQVGCAAGLQRAQLAAGRQGCPPQGQGLLGFRRFGGKVRGSLALRQQEQLVHLCCCQQVAEPRGPVMLLQPDRRCRQLGGPSAGQCVDMSHVRGKLCG